MPDLHNLTDEQLDEQLEKYYEEICRDFANIAQSDILLGILDEIERRLNKVKQEIRNA